MSERMVERDERGREIVYVDEKCVPCTPEWNKHINNLVERGEMENAMSAARDMMNLGIEHGRQETVGNFEMEEHLLLNEVTVSYRYFKNGSDGLYCSRVRNDTIESCSDER